jgi:hypothetical protein
MQTTDSSIQTAMGREKNEEIGELAQVKVCLTIARPVLFHKKDGSQMIVPHHIAQFVGGKVVLSDDEYSEYKWAGLDQLQSFEPKVENIPELIDWALKLKVLLTEKDFVIV